MSVSCGVECVVVLGCLRWAWKRCTYIGADDSATWTTATPAEFSPIPRICRVILAVYEDDLSHPVYPPPGGYGLDPNSVLKRVTYEETLGRAPSYLIYLDRENKEIILAIRGLNLVKESDYKVLLDNQLGRQMFDGGYVHHGLLKSAIWVLENEGEYLRSVWEETGKEFDMVFAGHSLGSGVASLLTVIAVNRRELLGGIPREKIRCYAVAPARCMSLNLAVKYANVITSVVLQDDFLPRTPTPLEDIFKSVFCLPCLLFWVCLRDTFIPQGRKLKDPRRLYAPGRIYHHCREKILQDVILASMAGDCNKFFMETSVLGLDFHLCGRFPPEVRTAIPVEGRFEHIVLSCNATSDHAIIWIEREAEKALQRMMEISSETVATAPKVQKMERLLTLEKEHKDALQRAVSLNIPHAVTTPDIESSEAGPSHGDHGHSQDSRSKANASWDEVVKVLFKRSESGQLLVKRDEDVPG